MHLLKFTSDFHHNQDHTPSEAAPMVPDGNDQLLKVNNFTLKYLPHNTSFQSTVSPQDIFNIEFSTPDLKTDVCTQNIQKNPPMFDELPDSNLQLTILRLTPDNSPYRHKFEIEDSKPYPDPTRPWNYSNF